MVIYFHFLFPFLCCQVSYETTIISHTELPSSFSNFSCFPTLSAGLAVIVSVIVSSMRETSSGKSVFNASSSDGHVEDDRVGASSCARPDHAVEAGEKSCRHYDNDVTYRPSRCSEFWRFGSGRQLPQHDVGVGCLPIAKGCWTEKGRNVKGAQICLRQMARQPAATLKLLRSSLIQHVSAKRKTEATLTYDPRKEWRPCRT